MIIIRLFQQHQGDQCHRLLLFALRSQYPGLDDVDIAQSWIDFQHAVEQHQGFIVPFQLSGIARLQDQHMLVAGIGLVQLVQNDQAVRGVGLLGQQALHGQSLLMTVAFDGV